MIISQLLAAVGVAGGVAIGGLLAERLSGTVAAAGLAPTSSVLGAALCAVPLARLAARRGRSCGLAAGYLLALAGTGLILTAAATGVVPLLFVGLAAFGAADAAGLQARFAAAELVGASYRARALSVVMWATTLGSVAGPNLAELGSSVGRALRIEPLTGPYLFAAVAFGCAVVVLSVGMTGGRGAREADHASPAPPRAALLPALREGLRHPKTRLGIVAVVCSHTIMVGVMAMTPLHLTHRGVSLEVVGLVISLHILAMYVASPILGWLADRCGGATVIGLGVIILAASLVLGGVADLDGPMITVTLGLLGLGWSAGVIGGSALLATTVSDRDKVSLQGGADGLMNLAAAGAAALSGLVVGLAGYPALNLVAAVVAVPMATLVLHELLRRQRISR